MKSNRFKKKLPLFLAACVISALLAASQTPVFAEATFGSVSGVVQRSFTGTPLVSSDNSEVAARVASSALPAAVDLVGCNTPDVMNQGNAGSCVGFAIAYAKTFQEVKEIGWQANTPKHIFSPAYIWNQLNGGINQGTTVKEGLDLLVSQGCSTLDKMPYSDTDFTQTPSQSARDQAARFKAVSWEYETTLNDLKASLAAGDPVIWDCYVYDSLADLNPQNNVYTGKSSPSEVIKSLHAMCIVGYDDSMCNGTGAVKVINSYSGWGDGGYAWIAYNLLFDPAYTVQSTWHDAQGNYNTYYGLYKINDAADELIQINNTSDLAADDVAIFKNYTNYMKYRCSDSSSYSTSLYMSSYPETNYNYSKMAVTYSPSTSLYNFTPIASTLETNDFSTGSENVYNLGNNRLRSYFGINASTGLGDMTFYTFLSFKDWCLTPTDNNGNPGGTGYFKLGMPPTANTQGNTSYMSCNFSFDANYNCTPYFAWKIFKY
jgi:C1A family cysteine protease